MYLICSLAPKIFPTVTEDHAVLMSICKSQNRWQWSCIYSEILHYYIEHLLDCKFSFIYLFIFLFVLARKL